MGSLTFIYFLLPYALIILLLLYFLVSISQLIFLMGYSWISEPFEPFSSFLESFLMIIGGIYVLMVLKEGVRSSDLLLKHK